MATPLGSQAVSWVAVEVGRFSSATTSTGTSSTFGFDLDGAFFFDFVALGRSFRRQYISREYEIPSVNPNRRRLSPELSHRVIIASIAPTSVICHLLAG